MSSFGGGDLSGSFSRTQAHWGELPPWTASVWEGNCLFEALSHIKCFCDGQPLGHEALRAMLVDRVRQSDVTNMYQPTRRNDKMTSKSRIPKSARTGEAHGTGDRDSFDSASGAGNGAKIAFKFAKLNAADGKTREHENRLKIGGPPGTACAQHSLTVDPFS